MPHSVDLGKKLESIVTRMVKSGRYNSKSEVLREGVRLVEERERRLKGLDKAIAAEMAGIDLRQAALLSAATRRDKTKPRGETRAK